MSSEDKPVDAMWMAEEEQGEHAQSDGAYLDLLGLRR
jgi:hypothetical protein